MVADRTIHRPRGWQWRGAGQDLLHRNSGSCCTASARSPVTGVRRRSTNSPTAWSIAAPGSRWQIGNGVLDALPLAVLGPEAPPAPMTADAHRRPHAHRGSVPGAAPAPRAGDSGADRGYSPRHWRAAAAAGAHSLPTRYSRHARREKGMPLLTGPGLDDAVAVHGLARPTAAVDYTPA